MTVVQTLVVFVGIPVAILGALALATMWPKLARAPRYRSGQPWQHEPIWWTANRAALPTPRPPAERPADPSSLGGARGTW